MPNQPLKRPTLGRPRGRPPGPKQPGMNRSPRGRSPVHSSGSLPWQNMMYDQNAMNYMLKYQEELLRQYNTLSQMNAMNLGQFTRPTTSSAAGSLLNPSQLVQTFTQIMSSGMNPLTMGQLSQSLSHLNPNLLKKLVEQCTSNQSQTMGSNWNFEEMIKQSMLAKTVINKPVTKPPKATYTTAGFSKNLPSTSSFKPKLPVPEPAKVNPEV